MNRLNHQKLILVVEDNPLVREHVVGLISTFGYQVVEAQNGPEALLILQSDVRVDLLFTDMVMPGGMSGVDLAKKANELRPQLLVLYTTGFSPEGLTGDKAPAGDVLISKPYRKAELGNKLAVLLED